MNNTVWKSMRNSVAINDIHAVIDHTVNIENRIFDTWQKQDHEEFELMIRLYRQNIDRIKRDYISNEYELYYFLGIISGVIQTFDRLYRQQKETDNTVNLLSSTSKKANEIIKCLFETNNCNGMKHGELAEMIGSSPSSLTNIMKRILLSGAVEASRTGKNTYYILSNAGKRFYIQHIQKHNSNETERIISLLEQLIACSPAAQKGQVLGVGDTFTPIIDDTYGNDIYIEEIQTFGHLKYAKLNNSITTRNKRTNGEYTNIHKSRVTPSHFDNERTPFGGR